MPTYDYVCSACGHRMEVVHGIHGHGPERCPLCGSAMRKAFVAPAVHFKGSGWAKKDRGAAKTAKAGAKSGSGDGGSGVTTGGADGPSAGSSDGASQSGSGSVAGSSTASSPSGDD